MTIFYDFFDIIYGQGEYNSKRDLVPIENGIPLISSKGIDQGIYGYFDIKPEYKHVISVPRTGTICYAFYQGEECCIDDNCLVMIPKKELSIQEMIYFVMLVRKEGYKYVYGRQVTPERLGNTITPNLPQWVNKISTEISMTKKPFHEQKLKLTDRQWKSFRYDGDLLFSVEKGSNIRVREIVPNGKTPLISALKHNNGLSGMVDADPQYDSNMIAVIGNGNAGVGEAFYQPFPFCATMDVNILKTKFKLNEFIAMFLICLIRKERYRYNFGRKWNPSRMKESIIMLPITSDGKPDWQFMEDYIKSLPYSSNLQN